MIFNRQKKTLSIGDAAENKALAHLKENGLSLVAKNYRCKYGEIDLIVKDERTLVFVEVRFRKSNKFGSPIESVNFSKQEKVRVTAQHYLIENNLGESCPTRFDVIGLTPEDVQWIKNAF